ncbi:MAG: cell division protein ZapA [Thermaurantiacus sp.]
MAEVTVSVGGRSYRLACRDGDEPGLLAAAARVDGHAEALGQTLGSVSESRLLLMSALLLAGELAEREQGRAPARGQTGASDGVLAERLERLADRLEAAAGLEPAAPPA